MSKEKYKEAAQRLLFGGKAPKDQQPSPSVQEEAAGGQSEVDDTVPLEDTGGLSPDWNTISMPRDIFTGSQSASPTPDNSEPTLRDIFSAVTACTMSISTLANEIKGVKAEISFVWQDMQKLRERTAAIEGRISAVEDDIAPMQRDLQYNCHLTAQHAACLDDLENRMRCNNVRALGIPERTEGKISFAFIEN